MKVVGTRAEVMQGVAKHTSGDLTKKNLKRVKGKIVSIAASKAAKLRLKNSRFKAFINFAKQSKTLKKIQLAPKKRTAAYKKLMK